MRFSSKELSALPVISTCILLPEMSLVDCLAVSFEDLPNTFPSVFCKYLKMKPRTLSSARNVKNREAKKPAPAASTKQGEKQSDNVQTALANPTKATNNAPQVSAQIEQPSPSLTGPFDITVTQKSANGDESVETKAFQPQDVRKKFEELRAELNSDGKEALQKALLEDPHLTGALYKMLGCE